MPRRLLNPATPLSFFVMCSACSTPLSAALALLTASGQLELGFETIDGCFVSFEEGRAALHSGKAVLVGGLLVGFIALPASTNLPFQGATACCEQH